MIKPADLIFVRSTTALGWLIRWFERSRGEEESWTNHVAGIGKSDNVIEAQTHVITSPFEEWKEGKDFQIWRTNDLDDNGRMVIADYAERQIGRGYGYMKIIPHALDGLLSKVAGGSPYVFRRMCLMNQYPICSWVWAYAYHQKGLDFGCSPRKVSPDDQLDFVSAHPLKWFMVFASSEVKETENESALKINSYPDNRAGQVKILPAVPVLTVVPPPLNLKIKR